MVQQIISSHLEHVCSLWDPPIYNSYDIPQAWKEHGLYFLHALEAFRLFLRYDFFFFLTYCFPIFPITGLHLFFFLWFEYRLTLSRQRIISPARVDGYFHLAPKCCRYVRFRYLISGRLCSPHQHSFNWWHYSLFIYRTWTFEICGVNLSLYICD